VLLDYGRFIVHIFTQRLREYYDLERLWRAARRTDVADPSSGISAADGSGLYLQPGEKKESGLYLQPRLKRGSPA
jgi:hypothetical protein